MAIIFYGLVLLGVTFIAFVLYAFIMSRRFLSTNHLSQQLEQGRHEASEKDSSIQPHLLCSGTTFKYKKGIADQDYDDELTSFQTECVVCLSGFEDEECVRQLPYCRHCFHDSCIDMWLYSHSICPICRTPTKELKPHHDGASTSTRYAVVS